MDVPAKRVLLVDDDARTVRRLAQMLREDGFSVDIACDGASAIEHLGHPPFPDVLVTDLLMPNADGLSLGKFARLVRPGLPIIFVTGYPHLVTDSLDPRAVVLVKPIDYADLADRLRNAGW